MHDQKIGEESRDGNPLTKAERKQKRREEKMLHRERQAKREKYKRILVWAGVAVGLVAIVWLVSNVNKDKTLDTGSSVSGGQIREDDWVRGNREAGVVVVEYADFQCPACASFSGLVNQLSNSYGDRVAFVYRNFPLIQIHRNAELAAYAAEAAGRQGKFWEMHDILYERQDDWSESSEAQKMFTEYASELALDIGRWQADGEAKDVKDKVSNSYSEAIGLGLTSTPSFILNGKKIEARSYEQFEQFIKQALGEGA